MASILNSDKSTHTPSNDLWTQRTLVSEGRVNEEQERSPKGLFDSYLAQLDQDKSTPQNTSTRSLQSSQRPESARQAKDKNPNPSGKSDKASPQTQSARTTSKPVSAQDSNGSANYSSDRKPDPKAPTNSDRTERNKTDRAPNSPVNSRERLAPTSSKETGSGKTSTPAPGQQASDAGSVTLRTSAPPTSSESDAAYQTPSKQALTQTGMPATEAPMSLSQSSESVLKDLETMGFAAGGRDEMMMESPLLALLSGHLEQLMPQNLPSLIGDSPLMQSILGATDLKALFDTPFPLNKIFQQLGLGFSELGQAIQQSAFAQEPVTLGEVLGALGFDVRTLEKGASSLKDILQHGQLPDLMVKTAKLKAQHQAEELAASAQAANLIPPPTTLPNRIVSQETMQEATALQPMGKTSKPASTATTDSRNTQNPIAADVLWGLDPNQGLLIPIDKAPELAVQGQQGPSNLDALTALLQKQAPQTQVSNTLPSELSQMSDQSTLPLVNPASSDPFAALADKWQKQDVQTLSFLNSSVQNMNFEQPKDRLLGDSKAAPPSTDILPQIGLDLSSALGQQNIALPAKDPVLPKNSNDLLSQLGLIALSPDGQTSRDDTQSSDQQGFGASSQDGTPFFMNQAIQKADNNKQSFQLQNATPANANNPMMNAEGIKKIFDRASMMVKEGGGSIRIDLGNEGLGAVDLALDIKDKTVELRIIASSHQAREILSQELPKLRESLLQQNLNLDKVEIGLGGGSAWSQSSGNGQSNGQNFQWAEQSSYRGPQGSREVRTYSQTSSSRQVGVNPRHNGLIQVRV